MIEFSDPDMDRLTGSLGRGVILNGGVCIGLEHHIQAISAGSRCRVPCPPDQTPGPQTGEFYFGAIGEFSLGTDTWPLSGPENRPAQNRPQRGQDIHCHRPARRVCSARTPRNEAP